MHPAQVDEVDWNAILKLSVACLRCVAAFDPLISSQVQPLYLLSVVRAKTHPRQHENRGVLSSSLAHIHIRAARISPAVLTTPPAWFVPPPQGVGLPIPPPPGPSTSPSPSAGNEGNAQTKETTCRLLEECVERDGWRGVLDMHTRLRDARRAEAATEARGMGMYMSI
jgi:hypothetical protein